MLSIGHDGLAGEELQQNIRSWLSPPDPWKNHNIARGSQHTGTGAWWIHGEAFLKWKHSSPTSLLWLHGKRQYLRCHYFPTTHYFHLVSGSREEHPLVH